MFLPLALLPTDGPKENWGSSIHRHEPQFSQQRLARYCAERCPVHTSPRGRNGNRSAIRRVVEGAVAVLLLSISGVVAGSSMPAEAAPVAAPQVLKVQAYNSKIDFELDELRASLVLKVPHGYVNPVTGELQSVGGRYLRIGYDYDGINSDGRPNYRNMAYINTYSAAGANAWAHNIDEYYTVHKVITSGENDYLVISIEGDLDIPVLSQSNTPGGSVAKMNLYFTLLKTTNPSASSWQTDWIRTAQTAHPIDLNIYTAYQSASSRSGPVVQVQYDGTYGLWSGRQANWGQVLDFGLNGNAPGFLPSNSIPVDMTNYAFKNINSGPAGSVSDSFWYAWVHEDGTLVKSINTAPIHVTGVVPHNGLVNNTYVVKNVTPASPSSPSLAYTNAAGAQGLTTNVKQDGRIDFTNAGGSGYYRLVVWPEAKNPSRVTVDNGSPLLSYTATELFTGTRPVPGRLSQAWTVGSVYYKYDIKRPGAPEISTPTEGAHLSSASRITISGTGTPGHSITLKFAAGDTITNTNDTTVTTLVDGDRNCTTAWPCTVVVDPSGRWTYTYTPSSPLADRTYTVVALQTEQASGYSLTSSPSNPKFETAPSAWGVTFTIDTVAPGPLTFPCPASPSENTTPTLKGSGVEAGATVRVYQNGALLGPATVSGSTWSYAIAPALTDGTYVYTVSQADRASNESALNTPACTYLVSGPVPIVGVKSVAGVKHGDPFLASVDASNWEITATTGSTTTVISGSEIVKLDRGVTYTIAERLRTTPAPAPNAARYSQRGDLDCVDGSQQPLPTSVFDAQARKLKLGKTHVVAAPISCTFTNQTSHISYVTKRMGGMTESPSTGWSLTASTSGASVPLTPRTVNTEALPATYSLTVAVPGGLSLAAVQTLTRDDASCAALATAPTNAPERCWVEVDASAVPIEQGQHTVFRTVAASPADMPALPMTGGAGAWMFTAAGSALGALAILTWIVNRRRRRLLAHHR